MKSIPGKLKFLILIIVLGVVLAFVTVTRWDLKRRAQLVADEEGAVEHASLTIRSMLDGTYDLNDSAISERVVDTFMARKVSLSLSDVFEIHTLLSLIWLAMMAHWCFQPAQYFGLRLPENHRDSRFKDCFTFQIVPTGNRKSTR